MRSPIFGQIVQGFSPSVAGSMLLPGSLFAAAVLPLTGRVSDKMPAPYVMIFGLSIIAISMFMLAGADTKHGLCLYRLRIAYWPGWISFCFASAETPRRSVPSPLRRCGVGQGLPTFR